MKARQIQYAIENPCDEPWNRMVPEMNGRFCSSCEKLVVDFTEMPDFSIVHYLENHKHQQVCGRFTKSQLERVYSLNQLSAPVFDLRAVVLGLALTTFSAVHSLAQTEIPEQTKPDTSVVLSPPVMGTVSSPNVDLSLEKQLSGTITNRLDTYQWIFVHLKTQKGKTIQTVQPDEKGNFIMELDWKKKPAYIEIEGAGFETVVRTFSSMNTLSNIRIELLEQEVIIGEVIRGGEVKNRPSLEDPVLQRVELGNVSFRKVEK